MKKSRVNNSLYNVIASLFEFFVKILLVFITRTIFIKKLGTDFLGLDGLYSNILSIMSITELGFGAAIIYSLYKPIVKNDKYKIKALMNIYKKCYFIIGVVITVLGIFLMPFLPIFIHSNVDFGNIYFLFFLYILQTITTYWVLAYKEAILIADQNKYKTVFVNNIIIVIKFIFQIISLIIFKSFELYIFSGIITNVFRNILIARIVNNNYPYLKEYNNETLDKIEKTKLIKNVTGMSLYKISSTVMSSTDNIIISSFISLTITGIYSNYLLIVSNIKIIMNTIFSSMTSSVGNLYAEGDIKKSEFIFRCINLLNFWFYGFSAICLYVLLNPFINIWLGQEYTFGTVIVFIIVLNFITDGLQQAVIMYKDACGLFWKGKLRPVFSAISNIILSIIFVKMWGIFGVILGSIVSRMITTWWFDPYLVYKNAFKKSPKKYYYTYAVRLLVILLIAFSINYFTDFLTFNMYINLLLKFIVCIIITNVLFWLITYKSDEYCYLKTIVLNKARKLRR